MPDQVNLIDGINPEEIHEPTLVPSGTKVTIKIERVMASECKSEASERSGRYQLLIFASVIEADDEKYIGAPIQHRLNVPNRAWLEYHNQKDGPAKADQLLRMYKDTYGTWLNRTIKVGAEEANDLRLYEDLELEVTVKLDDGGDFGERSVIGRVLVD